MTNFQKIAALVVAAVIVLAGAVGYSVFRAPAEASAPLEAIPLAATASSAPSASAVAAAASPTASAAASAESTTEASAASSAAAETSGAVLAEIVQEESEVRFVIDEVLNDTPTTVVGVTDQVAGELSIDASDPSKTQVGVIQVNARTLATDNDFRNRAIKNQILQTDQYELITFTPTEITGLPAEGAVGQTYSFQMTGDLTIRDVTKQVTFDVTATPASETRLEGTANATIRYADFGISIPQVRQVASVDEDLRVEIDFVVEPK